MLTLKDLSDTELEQARYEKDHYPIPVIRKRYNVIYLLSKGYNRQTVCDLACVHRNSIKTYINMVNTGGLSSLQCLNYKGAKSRLEGHKVSIADAFRLTPPRNSAQAAQRIEQITGIRLSTCRVRAFMHRLGMKCCKAGHIPAKADVDKQAIFKQTKLEPLIQLAQEGKCHLFFMDSAHFILQPFICMFWCFSRIFIKAAAGRNRINVLGALNAVSLQLETIINTDYINATTIIELLQQLAQKYTKVPIYIILDNARYQHCHLVIETATKLGISLVFLPPYSPNLNLIERLWKFIKKKTLYGQYYETAKAFHHAIHESVDKIKNNHYQNELSALLTLNFQTFAQNLTI